jgi:GAF domain-containing protein
MRTAALITRSNPPEVVSYLRSLGITNWQEPTRVPGQPEMGFESRLCVPLRYSGELVGFLFLIDTTPVRDEELTILHNAAPQLAELVRRDWADADHRASEIDPLLRDLVGADRSAAAAAVTELRLGLYPSTSSRPPRECDERMYLVKPGLHADDTTTLAEMGSGSDLGGGKAAFKDQAETQASTVEGRGCP